MKFILALCSLYAFTLVKGQCDHTINLIDTWGDGWNGNSISVSVNGIEQGPFTLASGSSGSFTFTASNGDAIVATHSGSSWPEENEWTILDGFGSTIALGTPSSNNPTLAVGACPSAGSNQPFIPHMEAYVNGSTINNLNPLDTGFVDLCVGDSVLFVATPDFYNSLEATGTGYSQDVNTNIDFDWTIGNLSYPNNDTIIFVANTSSGQLVSLVITDQNGESSTLNGKIRTGTTPNFSGIYPLYESICEGEITEIIGGANGEGSSFSIPAGDFGFGTSQYITELTYLPDGSGAQYQTPIIIGGFPQGSVITNPGDLSKVCITIEHSYSGDLEIWLQCPNGTTVPIVNSYGGGAIPGGSGGGGTYLGDPIDDGGGGGPGEGWEYCFSSVLNDIGPMTQNWGNTVPAPNFGNGNPSVNPNFIYEPDNSFSELIGCPFNGEWTLFVQDNLSIDDGYIFGWGMDFDAPTNEITGYQNTVDSAWWSPNSTIINDLDGSSIEVAPEMGNSSYTFNVMDDFDCTYDTTIHITINEVLASMTATPSGACIPFIASFDYSQSIGDWFYLDFGDGSYYIDSVAGIMNYLYSEPLSSPATLYVNSGVCSDTFYMNINTPTVSTNYLSETVFCGDGYPWNGNIIYNSGTYSDNFLGVNGCDSIVVLELTVIDEDFDLSFSSNQQLFTEPPFAVQFTNTTPDMGNYDFWWDFGDGTSIQSNNLNVFHEYTSNGLFSVILYASDPTSGCTDTIIQTDYISTTGQSAIYENEIVALQVHPNPTTSFIIIQAEKSLNNTFKIFDQQGRQVMKGELSGKEIKVSLGTLTNGTYSIHIQGSFKPTIVVKQ